MATRRNASTELAGALAEYADRWLEVVARPFQRSLWRDITQSDFVGILGARQIGKSMLIGFAAVMLAGGAIGPAADVMIVSKDQKTSANLIRYVRTHLDALGAFVSEDKILDAKLGSVTRVALSNGRYIFAMPGSSASIQGFTGHVIIDELSETGDDPEAALEQAMAVGSSRRGLKLVICSNADHEGSFVANLWTSPDLQWAERRADWRLSTTTIVDVHPNGLPEQLERIRRTMRPAAWARWYMCEFVGVEGAAFDLDVLRACIGRAMRVKGPTRRILTIDVGHVVNPSGVIVADIHPAAIRVVHADLWFGRDADWQESKLVELVDSYGVRDIIGDVGAVGFELGRRLTNRYGARFAAARVNDARDKGATTIDQLARTGALSLPEGEMTRELIADLTAMRRAKDDSLVVPVRPGPNRHKIHCDLGEALLYTATHPDMQRAISSGVVTGATANVDQLRQWSRMRGQPTRLR